MAEKLRTGSCTVPFLQISQMLPHTGRWFLLQNPVIVALDEDGRPTGGMTGFAVRRGHCEGHFPGNPVFPGVLLVELAAQMLGVVAYGPTWQGVDQETAPIIPFFRGFGNVTFRQAVDPPDNVTVIAEITKHHSAMVVGNVRIERGNSLVAEINKIRIAPQ